MLIRHSHSSRLIVGLSVALLIDGLTATAASAVYAGDVTTTAPPWSAYITTVDKFTIFQTQESNCTGTIISDSWVLTAAHCIVESDKQGRPTSTLLPVSRYRVVLGRGDLNRTYQGGQWTVDQAIPYPHFDPNNISGDIALLHLQGPLLAAALPLPLAPSGYTLPDGAKPIAFGYGNTTQTYSDLSDLSKYRGTASANLRSTVGGSYVHEASCSLAMAWCLRRKGPSEIMHGDSGGPWVTTKTDPTIVAVTSYNNGFTPTGTISGFSTYHAAAKISVPDVHKWLADTADIYQGRADTIYRNPSTGAAWLFSLDGLRHSIPDGGTYLCLTGMGREVVNLGAFDLAELPTSPEPATCGVGGRDRVLIFYEGLGQDPQRAGDFVATTLRSSGYTVTTTDALPADLSNYAAVFQFGAYRPLSASEVDGLTSYARSGGGLFLTGEWGCCEALNSSVETIVNRLIISVGGINVGGQVSYGVRTSCAISDDLAAGTLATRPFVIDTLGINAAGTISNIGTDDVLCTYNGDAVAAAWADTVGSGRLAVIMDVNWADPTYSPDIGSAGMFTQNLALFLTGRSDPPLQPGQTAYAVSSEAIPSHPVASMDGSNAAVR